MVTAPMAERATIKCARETWAEINRRRQSPSESMNDVLQRLLEQTREGAGEAERKG